MQFFSIVSLLALAVGISAGPLGTPVTEATCHGGGESCFRNCCEGFTCYISPDGHHSECIPVGSPGSFE